MPRSLLIISLLFFSLPAFAQGLDLPPTNTEGTWTATVTLPRDHVEPEIVEKTLMAAERGDAASEFEVGQYYYHGLGLQKDYLAAARWYRKAAEQHFPAAQGVLGYMFQQGVGVKQDWGEAYFWYSLSTQAGEHVDDAPRDEAAKNLTETQKAAVDKRVAQWMKDHPRRWIIQVPNALDKDAIKNSVRNTREYLQSHNVPTEGPDR